MFDDSRQVDVDEYSSVIWKISRSHFGKVSGPALYFLDRHLNLEANIFTEDSSVRIEISVFFQGSEHTNGIRPFHIRTAVLFGKTQRFVKNFTVPMNENENEEAELHFTIWSELEKNLNVGESETTTFVIMILPLDVWTTLPDSFAEDTVKFVPSECDLRDDIGKLFDNQQCSDLVLVCGRGEKVQAHKAILSARSEVFARMFSSTTQEPPENVLEFKDMETAIFREFIRFLYTDEFSDLPVDEVRKLYAVANEYHVQELQKKCAHCIINSYVMDAETVEQETPPPDEQPMKRRKLEETVVKDKLKNLFRSKEWQDLPPNLVQLMVKDLILKNYI